MSRLHRGRFNTADVGAVYLPREPDTAIEELRRRAARDGVSLAHMHPRSIPVVDLLLHEVVDLTTPNHTPAGLESPRFARVCSNTLQPATDRAYRGSLFPPIHS
jgi:RES domain-containing protein